MKALVLETGQMHFRPDFPPPVPQPEEALVRVLLAGICATDLEMVKGYVPDFQGVLGHEFVGEVVRSPDPAWHGRRVVSQINISCNACWTCRHLGPEHCPQRQVVGIRGRDGVFAEYVALPLANLLEVPAHVADEAAVFAEPLAAACRILEQVQLRPSTSTAVVGPGRLGMLVGLVLSDAGLPVTMLGRRPASLALPAKLGLATALVAETPDNQFEIVVDTTGQESGLVQAMRLVRPLGTLILKSTFAGAAGPNLSRLVVEEITLVGSRCGPFAPALRLLERGAIPTQALIEAEHRLEEGEGALALAAQPGVRKVLLRP